MALYADLPQGYVDPLYREPELTVPDLHDLLTSLCHVWKRLLKQEPEIDQLACLLALIALETNHLTACYCWNVGNLMSDPDDKDHCWTAYPVRSRDEEGVRILLPLARMTRRIAYDDLDEGVEHLITTLSTTEPLEVLWQAIQQGDPYEMATEMCEWRSLCSSNDEQIRILVQLFDQHRLLILEELDPDTLSISEIEQLRRISLIDLGDVCGIPLSEPRMITTPDSDQ